MLGAVPATTTSDVLIERGEEPPSLILAARAEQRSPGLKPVLVIDLEVAGTEFEVVPLIEQLISTRTDSVLTGVPVQEAVTDEVDAAIDSP